MKRLMSATVEGASILGEKSERKEKERGREKKEKKKLSFSEILDSSQLEGNHVEAIENQED